MKTPIESYQRQCDWSEGWDAAQVHFEERLDTMAEEYEDLLRDALESAERHHRRIEQLEARSGISARIIEDIKELIA